MFISKREAWPMGFIAIGVTLALALSLSLAVPKAGAVTIAELLAQIQALQAQLLQLQAAQGIGTATACTFTQSLYLGVSNAQVKCLQQYLNSAGYTVALSGAGSVGNETNYYGPLTKAAVAKWQAANNVSPAVGYFGPISQAKYTAIAGGVVTPGGVVIPPAAGGLSVALRADTPASRTIVAGAAMMPFAKWNFTAGSGDVIVTSLKLTRSGISSDAELGSAYLYDADTGDYISQYTGLGSGILSFSNTGGLFTVKAGTTKNVELRLDVSLSASNNHTMAWNLNAAADVTSNATSVSGTFPMTPNAMTFVTVDNPAIATLTATKVDTGSSVNAGTTGYLAGSFTLLAANSAVLLDRVVLTQNGTLISGTDVANIKLVTTGGQQIGQVLPNLKSDGTGTFVMSPAYEIPSGQTIQINVYADVLGGVNRTLKFNVLNLRDVLARDKTYNVGVNPTATIAMTQSDVEQGTLVITLDPSSPTGNIAPSQTNVTVGKFKVVSYGEQVKVLWVPFQLVTGGGTTDFSQQVDNIYLVDDAGNQIGTTITSPDTSVAAAGTWDNSDTPAATFGTSGATINYLIPANTTRIWSLKLDVMSTASSTMVASLVGAANSYQGQVSSELGTTSTVTTNTLTVTSNPFQAQLNTSVGTGSITKGQPNARIGSYVLSASSAEGINVSTITFTSSTTFPFANLLIKTNGVQFGNIIGSVNTGGQEFTFSGSSPFRISAGGSVTVDVYADVLSTATDLGSSYYIKLAGASAVGATTATTQTLKSGSTTVSSSNIVAQYNQVQTTGGTLTVAKDASTPAAYQAVMGKTGQSLAIWRLTADSNSDKSITDITVTDRLGTADHKAMFKNVQFYKGGVAIGPIVVSGTASSESSTVTGYTYAFHFTSPVVVPQNSGISLELRGDVASFADAGSSGTSNSVHTFRIESADDVTALSAGGSLTVTISGPNGSTATAVNAITVARTKLTVTSDPTGIVTTSHVTMPNDIMAYWVFSADPAGSVTINTVTMKLSGSVLSSIYVRLIDDADGTDWGNTAVTLIGGSASTSMQFYPDYSLTAGATKKIRVQADTTGSVGGLDNTFTVTTANTAGTVAVWSIDTDTGTANTAGAATKALCWGDGTTLCSAGGFNLETKVLPIYGPTLRY